MMKVAIPESIPVYEKPRGRPDALTVPGEVFYLSCRHQDSLSVAGSEYWVKLEAVGHFVGPEPLYRRRGCGEALTSSATPPP